MNRLICSCAIERDYDTLVMVQALRAMADMLETGRPINAYDYTDDLPEHSGPQLALPEVIAEFMPIEQTDTPFGRFIKPDIETMQEFF